MTIREVSYKALEIDGQIAKDPNDYDRLGIPMPEPERIPGPKAPENTPAKRDPDFPHVKTDPKGSTRILATKENLEELMAASNISVAYDVIKKRNDVRGVKHLPGEGNNVVFAELVSLSNLHGLPDKVVNSYLGTLAQENAHNPALTWLKSLPTKKIKSPVAEYVKLCRFAHLEWAEIAVSRWLIQAVAAADYAKRANDDARPEFAYTLVLVGGQGTGKTSGMRKLLPRGMQDYFTSGRALDVTNKDSHLAAVSNWIVELGEIDATFTKSSIDRLKAHLSDPTDNIRSPYARTVTEHPRQTVYVGTVNQTKFLKDITGNRRYWPVTLTADLPDIQEELITRLWQWAYQSYLGGAQWWLTAAEEVIHGRVLAQHEDSPLMDTLLDCYDFDSDRRDTYVTPSQILEEIGLGSNKSQTTALGILLAKTTTIERKTPSSREYALPPRTASNRYNR